jgi:hypothetical protein
MGRTKLIGFLVVLAVGALKFAPAEICVPPQGCTMNQQAHSCCPAEQAPLRLAPDCIEHIDTVDLQSEKPTVIIAPSFTSQPTAEQVVSFDKPSTSASYSTLPRFLLACSLRL